MFQAALSFFAALAVGVTFWKSPEDVTTTVLALIVAAVIAMATSFAHKGIDGRGPEYLVTALVLGTLLLTIEGFGAVRPAFVITPIILMTAVTLVAVMSFGEWRHREDDEFPRHIYFWLLMPLGLSLIGVLLKWRFDKHLDAQRLKESQELQAEQAAAQRDVTTANTQRSLATVTRIYPPPG